MDCAAGTVTTVYCLASPPILRARPTGHIPAAADLKNDRLPSKRPSLGEGASHALARFVITFCIGVAATLAWQFYGDAARERIASSSNSSLARRFDDDVNITALFRTGSFWRSSIYLCRWEN
jgi:hypothetical protein